MLVHNFGNVHHNVVPHKSGYPLGHCFRAQVFQVSNEEAIWVCIQQSVSNQFHHQVRRNLELRMFLEFSISMVRQSTTATYPIVYTVASFAHWSWWIQPNFQRRPCHTFGSRETTKVCSCRCWCRSLTTCGTATEVGSYGWKLSTNSCGQMFAVPHCCNSNFLFQQFFGWFYGIVFLPIGSF